MDGFETLIFAKQPPLALVTLNRPQALNTYNVQMRDDLFEVLSAIRADDDIRAVVFQGAGEKAFCAGADLSEFLSAPPPTAARRVRFERDVWGLFLSLEQPLVAAVHGYVLGSGMEIALCCDIRIAGEKTRFGLPETALGIIPAAGGTQTLPRAMGATHALEMLLTERWLDSQEALRLKLVHRVVPQEALLDQAKQMALRMAGFDPEVVRSAKRAVRQGMDLPLSQGLEMERRLARRIF
jgi:enoyl-CoA hydratase